MATYRHLYGPRRTEVAGALHEYYVLGFGTKDFGELKAVFRDELVRHPQVAIMGINAAANPSESIEVGDPCPLR